MAGLRQARHERTLRWTLRTPHVRRAAGSRAVMRPLLVAASMAMPSTAPRNLEARRLGPSTSSDHHPMPWMATVKIWASSLVFAACYYWSVFVQQQTNKSLIESFSLEQRGLGSGRTFLAPWASPSRPLARASPQTFLPALCLAWPTVPRARAVCRPQAGPARRLAPAAQLRGTPWRRPVARARAPWATSNA